MLWLTLDIDAKQEHWTETWLWPVATNAMVRSRTANAGEKINFPLFSSWKSNGGKFVCSDLIGRHACSRHVTFYSVRCGPSGDWTVKSMRLSWLSMCRIFLTETEQMAYALKWGHYHGVRWFWLVQHAINLTALIPIVHVSSSRQPLKIVCPVLKSRTSFSDRKPPVLSVGIFRHEQLFWTRNI